MIGFERLGDASDDLVGISRLGLDEEVGVDMRGTLRPFTEVSRGLVIVDITIVQTD